VREEYSADILPPYLQLVETLQGTTTRIEEEFLAPGFDQNAGPEPVHDGRWTSRTQEGDRYVLAKSR
jgi:hypothetical protein